MYKTLVLGGAVVSNEHKNIENLFGQHNQYYYILLHYSTIPFLHSFNIHYFIPLLYSTSLLHYTLLHSSTILYFTPLLQSSLLLYYTLLCYSTILYFATLLYSTLLLYYTLQRNMAVLASISSMCKVRNFKKFARTLGKVSLLGSYRIWLARRSNEWAPGSLMRA